ncbi:hypothetical protein JTE90_019868 [Oedothorax gibbosus]|uniref:Uncharacterized protein n=1 Tax=Oedothorax gibbosus TaxID=931172 RepID=A0AAV6VX79_9ARAC|nr:hypothetical protein JTE90_019868 [Oedothorax gibbosus]
MQIRQIIATGVASGDLNIRNYSLSQREWSPTVVYDLPKKKLAINFSPLGSSPAGCFTVRNPRGYVVATEDFTPTDETGNKTARLVLCLDSFFHLAKWRLLLISSLREEMADIRKSEFAFCEGSRVNSSSHCVRIIGEPNRNILIFSIEPTLRRCLSQTILAWRNSRGAHLDYAS